MIKKNLKFFLPLILAGVVFALHLYGEQEKKELINMPMSGLITEIKVNEKKTPTVKLDSYKFSFVYFNASLLDNLEIGDSLFKDKESREVEHYKKNKIVDSFELHRFYHIAY